MSGRAKPQSRSERSGGCENAGAAGKSVCARADTSGITDLAPDGGRPMSTPAKSFEDLRSILGKLDRKIDSARCRRLGIDPNPNDEPTADGGPLIGKAESAAIDSAPIEETPLKAENDDQVVRRRSPYGRAKPLNRGGQNGPGSAWLGGG